MYNNKYFYFVDYFRDYIYTYSSNDRSQFNKSSSSSSSNNDTQHYIINQIKQQHQQQQHQQRQYNKKNVKKEEIDRGKNINNQTNVIIHKFKRNKKKYITCIKTLISKKN